MRNTITRLLCTALVLCLLLQGCSSKNGALSDAGSRQRMQTAQSTESGQTIDREQETQAQLKKEISAFEITAHQRQLAADNEAGYRVLDAGRGNPNWMNTQSRYSFSRFMEFAIGECERTMNEGNMAGQAVKKGIGKRFDKAMDKENETDAFLLDAVDYCVDRLEINKDDLLKEMVDGIIGDYYPSPSRCLPCTEKILGAYLQDTMYQGENLLNSTRIFPTEGGSAAMAYIFDALNHNRLLTPGDQIAIATPIFTPYLEIPSVKDYNLVSVDITSTEENNWDISEKELKKLENPSIKAFFLVNPSNPASHALSQKTIERLRKVVEKNPDLIILTDDVYGTFVDGFQTIYSVIPRNTILVYSFSKLYGVTGWRVGLIAMNEDNVMDDLLGKLSEEDKDYLRDEYSIVTDDINSMPFIERVVADSRSIGLYHTSGLSTPSQIFMDFLALTHLVYEDEDPYIKQANLIVSQRYKILMKTLSLPVDEETKNARYYALIDIMKLCEDHYGKAFADWLDKSVTEIEFLDDLAKTKGLVLMYGPGFKAPAGTVRVSLANLNKEDYKELAERLFERLDEYYDEFSKEEALPDAA